MCQASTARSRQSARRHRSEITNRYVVTAIRDVSQKPSVDVRRNRPAAAVGNRKLHDAGVQASKRKLVGATVEIMVSDRHAGTANPAEMREMPPHESAAIVRSSIQFTLRNVGLSNQQCVGRPVGQGQRILTGCAGQDLQQEAAVPAAAAALQDQAVFARMLFQQR